MQYCPYCPNSAVQYGVWAGMEIALGIRGGGVVATTYEALKSCQCAATGLVQLGQSQRRRRQSHHNHWLLGLRHPGHRVWRRGQPDGLGVLLDYTLFPAESATDAGSFLSLVANQVASKEPGGAFADLDLDSGCLVESVHADWQHNAFMFATTFSALVCPADGGGRDCARHHQRLLLWLVGRHHDAEPQRRPCRRGWRARGRAAHHRIEHHLDAATNHCHRDRRDPGSGPNHPHPGRWKRRPWLAAVTAGHPVVAAPGTSRKAARDRLFAANQSPSAQPRVAARGLKAVSTGARARPRRRPQARLHRPPPVRAPRRRSNQPPPRPPGRWTRPPPLAAATAGRSAAAPGTSSKAVKGLGGAASQNNPSAPARAAEPGLKARFN